MIFQCMGLLLLGETGADSGDSDEFLAPRNY
jgi:hypothetical protein